MRNQQFKFLKIMLVQLILFFANEVIAQEPSPNSKIEQANSLYNLGKCEDAIALYSNIIKDKSETSDNRYLSLYRRAECNQAEGKFEDSIRDFEIYFKKYPDAFDGRLKASESYYNLGKYEEAAASVQLVTDPSRKIEVQILLSKIRLGQDDAAESIRLLRNIQNPGDWAPVVVYWQATAEQYRGDDEKAKSLFLKCERISPKDLWTKTACRKGALGELSNSQKSKNWYLYFGGGGLYDSNVAQSSTDSLSVSGGKNSSGSSGPQMQTVKTGTETKDFGYSANLGGSLAFVNNKSFQLWALINGSLNHYKTETSYNFESGSGNLGAVFFLDPKYQLDVNAGYLDTRYAFVAYQSYALATTKLSWYMSKKTSYGASLNFQPKLITNTTSGTYGGRINGYFNMSTISLWSAIDATRAYGEKAVISNNYVSSGSLFSNYTALTPSVGVGGVLFAGIYWTTDLSLGMTIYDAENVSGPGGSGGKAAILITTGAGPGGGPSGNQPGTSQKSGGLQGANSSASVRTDYLVGLSGSLSRNIIWDWLKISLNASYTSNTSTGFSGLPDSSTGLISSGSYKRSLFSLNTSLSF